jgi:hypothetical protein
MAFSKLRLTKKVIDDLDPTLGRQYIYDTVNSALAVLVTSAGTKSFYLVKKHQGVQVRQRIGNVADIPIERARAIASERVSALLTGSSGVRQDEHADPEKQAGQDQPFSAVEQTAQNPTPCTPATAKAAKHVRQEAPLPQEPEEEALTLGQVMEEYLAYAAEHRKPSTQTHYRYEWEHYLKAWAGTRTLASLRRREVTDLHQTLGRKNGHHQANRVLALLRAAINRAIREHELNLHNPAIAITFYREARRSRPSCWPSSPARGRATSSTCVGSMSRLSAGFGLFLRKTPRATASCPWYWWSESCKSYMLGAHRWLGPGSSQAAAHTSP